MALAALVPPEKNDALIYVIPGLSIALFVTWVFNLQIQNPTDWLSFIGIVGSAATLVLYVVGGDIFVVNWMLRRIARRGIPHYASYAKEHPSKAIEAMFLFINLYFGAWRNIPFALWMKDSTSTTPLAPTSTATRAQASSHRKITTTYIAGYAETYISNAVSGYAIRQRSWHIRLVIYLLLVWIPVFLILPDLLSRAPILFASWTWRLNLSYISLACFGFLIILGSTIYRHRKIDRYIRYVAIFLYAQVHASKDAMNQPMEYDEKTAKWTLRNELNFMQQSLVRSDWAEFATHSEELAHFLALEVPEDIDSKTYREILEHWFEIRRLEGERELTRTHERSLSWLIYFLNDFRILMDKMSKDDGVEEDVKQRAKLALESASVKLAEKIYKVLSNETWKEDIENDAKTLNIISSAATMWLSDITTHTIPETGGLTGMMSSILEHLLKGHLKTRYTMKAGLLLLLHSKLRYRKGESAGIWRANHHDLQRLYIENANQPDRFFLLCSYIHDANNEHIQNALEIIGDTWLDDLNLPEIRKALYLKVTDKKSAEWKTVQNVYSAFGLSQPR